jgi:hypothetical protein
VDIEAILQALNAGLSLERISMLERLIGRLMDRGITEEQEIYRAAVLTLHLQPEVERARKEMN